jgi:signal recognition particle subunit SRP54
MMSMIPGFDASVLNANNNDNNSQIMIKRYITIIESMTEKELDSTNIKLLSDQSRIMRLARGSGEAGTAPVGDGKQG